MARVGLNGVWGIHLAPKALCLFYALRQHPPKNDEFMEQFYAGVHLVVNGGVYFHALFSSEPN